MVLAFPSYFPVFSSPTATLEGVGNAGTQSSEKAGVGGSTPSLATTIPKSLAELWRRGTRKITTGDHRRLLDELLSGFLVQTHRIDHFRLGLHPLVHAAVRIRSQND